MHKTYHHDNLHVPIILEATYPKGCQNIQSFLQDLYYQNNEPRDYDELDEPLNTETTTRCSIEVSKHFDTLWNSTKTYIRHKDTFIEATCIFQTLLKEYEFKFNPYHSTTIPPWCLSIPKWTRKDEQQATEADCDKHFSTRNSIALALHDLLRIGVTLLKEGTILYTNFETLLDCGRPKNPKYE